MRQRRNGSAKIEPKSRICDGPPLGLVIHATATNTQKIACRQICGRRRTDSGSDAKFFAANQLSKTNAKSTMRSGNAYARFGALPDEFPRRASVRSEYFTAMYNAARHSRSRRREGVSHRKIGPSKTSQASMMSGSLWKWRRRFQVTRVSRLLC